MKLEKRKEEKLKLHPCMLMALCYVTISKPRPNTHLILIASPPCLYISQCMVAKIGSENEHMAAIWSTGSPIHHGAVLPVQCHLLSRVKDLNPKQQIANL